MTGEFGVDTDSRGGGRRGGKARCLEVSDSVTKQKKEKIGKKKRENRKKLLLFFSLLFAEVAQHTRLGDGRNKSAPSQATTTISAVSTRSAVPAHTRLGRR
jgi:hypothetical protein